jgi:hypothetical protein
MAADKGAIVKAFDEIGAKVESNTKSFYLLSYCSPSRAGKHEVTIEALVKDAKGNVDRSGKVQSEFDATGFAPGCDPNSPPSFDVTKGDALAPPPPKPLPPPPPPAALKGPEKKERKPAKASATKPPPKAQGAPEEHHEEGTAAPTSAEPTPPPEPPPAAPPPAPAKDFNP